MLLWFQMVRFRSATQPPLSKVLLLLAILSAEMSKALPVVRVMFSSLGVWSMESSPMNQREPSAESSLKTLTVPLGRGIPNLLFLVLESSILLLAFRFYSFHPPAFKLTRLYFLTEIPQALGMNYTCFWELSFRVTGSLRVYMWKSEKDFSEKEGGGAEVLTANEASAMGAGRGILRLLLTTFTSPAISLSLAFQYIFPLQLSMVTQPPTSAFFSA